MQKRRENVPGVHGYSLWLLRGKNYTFRIWYYGDLLPSCSSWATTSTSAVSNVSWNFVPQLCHMSYFIFQDCSKPTSWTWIHLQNWLGLPGLPLPSAWAAWYFTVSCSGSTVIQHTQLELDNKHCKRQMHLLPLYKQGRRKEKERHK